MASFLQLVFLACIVTAVVALSDWRVALLVGGLVGFVTAFQMERKRPSKAP